MFPQRLEERRSWLRRGFARSVEYALGQQAHLFLQVGDLFDSPEPRNVERQFVAESLAMLRDAGIRCLGITGNHDTPRGRSGGPFATPQGTYARLGGLRLLGDRGWGIGDRASTYSAMDTEIVVVDGIRIAVGGLAPDPTAQPGSDPLEGLEWRPGADFSLLLVHGSLQGHIYPGAPEPVIRRESVQDLGLDCLLVGHVHKFAVLRWGGTSVVVPGATEQMTFGEMKSRPGFVYLELEAGTAPRVQHVLIEAQPRRQMVIPSSQLSAGNPADLVMERLDSECDREAMVRLCLEGPITRQQYHDLRLRDVADFGASHCFFFDLDTTGLFVEEDLPRTAARTGRLSPREELIRFGEESREAATAPEEQKLIDEAMQSILSEYE